MNLSKLKIWIFAVLSSFFVLLSIGQAFLIKRSSAFEFDPTKWIFCEVLGEEGADIIKAQRTDWLPFIFNSKSNLGDTDNPNYSVHNGVLKVAGYKINEKPRNEEANILERFGLAGTTYSSYKGEWKYYNIDPCKDENGKSKKAAGGHPFDEDYIVSQPYGMTPWAASSGMYGGGGHMGLDIVPVRLYPNNLGLIEKEDIPIYSMSDGVVHSIGEDPNAFGGYFIRIKNDEGMIGYFHNKQSSTKSHNLKVGDTVKTGDVIGFLGSTGTTSPNGVSCAYPCTHIHLEYNDASGKSVDPSFLIKGEGNALQQNDVVKVSDPVAGGKGGSSGGNTATPTSNDYGAFYEGRLEPLSTWGEIHSSVDVRTKEFARGHFVAFGKAFLNNLANILLWIVKFILTFVLALISLSLDDVSAILGFTTTGGGTNEFNKFQEGFVKQLFTGIFEPLVFIMVLMSAVYIFVLGIVRKQYRAAIGAFAQMMLAIVIGYAIFAIPSLITLPNRMATLVQALVISGVGTNIATDGPETLGLCETELSQPPKAPANGFTLDNPIAGNGYMESVTDYMKAVLGCRMYSEYLFKPFVKAQFGSEFKDLTAMKNVNSEWTGDYSVHLGGNKKIKNLGLYHVSVFSGYHSGTDGKIAPLVNGVHRDYYRIVDILANYDEDVFKGTGLSGNDNSSSSSSSGGGIPGNVQKFLEENGDMAKKLAEESGLYASVMLAMAGIESAWGASPSGDFNYFGIKCFNSNCKTGLTTNEVYGGQTVTIQDGFQNFESVEDGWKGYAKFLWGCGAGADFKGGLKKNSGTPEEAIEKIIKAGYATDPTYVQKAIDVINQYDLKKYDTSGKEPTKPGDYEPCANGGGNPGGGGDGSSGGDSEWTQDVPVPQLNPVLAEWDYWIGNRPGHKFGYTFLMLILVIIGSILPIMFGMIAAMYGIGITLLSILAPVFLTFGVWAGKGNRIMLQYLGSLLSLILKKAVATFLLVISVIIVSTIMSMINEIGFIGAMIYFIVISFVLWKNKDKIIEAVAKINIGKLNGTPAMDAIGKTGGIAKGVTKVGVTSVISGVQALRNSGNLRTAGRAMRNQARQATSDEMYKSKTGRATLMSVEKTRREKAKEAKLNESAAQLKCQGCGTQLKGSYFTSDKSGATLCEICASASGFENMTEQQINKDDTQYGKSTATTRSSGGMGAGSTGKSQRKHLAAKGELSRYHISNDELATDFKFNSVDDWNDVDKERLHKRIRDSIEIVNSDMNRAKKDNRALSDYYIPEPLRPYLPAAKMASIVSSDDKDAYARAVREAWLAWYRSIAFAKGGDVKEIEKEIENISGKSEEQS